MPRSVMRKQVFARLSLRQSINETVPIDQKYDVIVTFVKPLEQAEKDVDREEKISALNRITGILSDSTMTLEEARAERLSHLS